MSSSTLFAILKFGHCLKLIVFSMDGSAYVDTDNAISTRACLLFLSLKDEMVLWYASLEASTHWINVSGEGTP